jgi:hypothetical protein
MTVTLSLFAGAGAQFLDNNGVMLSGGLVYTYGAGTTTPLAAYTSNTGDTALANPIVLDASGRVPTGQIWLTYGQGYKFTIKTSTGTLIGTYDNIPSAALPPLVNDAASIAYEQGATVTAGNFIIGQTYLITFIGSTNFQSIGAVSNTVGIYFTATGVGSGSGTAEISRSVEIKLQESISVTDFGAVGNGIADDTAAIQAALSAASNRTLYFPKGDYKISSTINFGLTTSILGEGPQASRIIATQAGVAVQINAPVPSPGDTYSQRFENFGIVGNVNTTFGFWMMRCVYCNFKDVWVSSPPGISAAYAGFRVSGAMYLNTYENCIANTTDNTQATVGSGWWIGNGLNEVGNANALTNVNTYITCRGANYANGYDVDYSAGNVFLNCDAEICSTATFHVRCLYSKFIAPWQEVGDMVFDQYIPTDGSGGTTAAQSPIYNEVNCSLPSNAIINYGNFTTFSGGKLNNLTIGTNAINTRLLAIEINNTLTNNGSDGNLQYSTGGDQYHVVQYGTLTKYLKSIANSGTTIAMSANQSITSNKFGNLVLNSGAAATEIAGTSPMVLMNKTVEPGSSPANSGYLFVRDNGAGKMQLCAKFTSGVAQVIATEP